MRVHKGSERARAEIISLVATSGGNLTSRDMRTETGIDHVTISRSIHFLERMGWLEIPGGSAQNIKFKPVATPTFWEAAAIAVKHANDLSGTDKWHFVDGLEERLKMVGLPAESYDREVAEANYLGRAALLGNRHDLTQLCDWFSGSQGWKTLIEVTVSRFSNETQA